jgi:hypothetical protein
VLRSDSNGQAETASVWYAAVSVFKITNASDPRLFGVIWQETLTKEQSENENLAQGKKGESTQETN